MSIPVDLAALDEALAVHGGAAFLLTSGDDGRPHVSHVAVHLRDGVLEVAAGRRTAANVAARPAAVVLWPPVEPGGYSLIIDVTVHVEGELARCVPEHAVLHRPAPQAVADPGACGHDCRPI
jgi:hypothetical protein